VPERHAHPAVGAVVALAVLPGVAERAGEGQRVESMEAVDAVRPIAGAASGERRDGIGSAETTMSRVAYTAIEQRLLSLLRERALRRGEFTLSSGQKSDYYIDGKMVTLDGEGALAVAEAILERIGDRNVAAIGGLTLGADPIAGAVAAVSAAKGRPVRAFIVRKDVKEHGTRKEIEGPLRAGDPVVVVEDVVSTGSSAMQAVEAVRALGCPVVAVMTLVDREMGGREAFQRRGIPYEPLFTKTELLG
jgi:orotate phosphoribosyltransferase